MENYNPRLSDQRSETEPSVALHHNDLFMVTLVKWLTGKILLSKRTRARVKNMLSSSFSILEVIQHFAIRFETDDQLQLRL